MKILTTIAASVLAVGVLAGCGSSTEAYCDDLEDAKGTFDAMEEGDFENFDKVFSTFEDMSQKAPDDVKDEWETLNSALQEFKSALDDAGLDISDLDNLSSGEVPEGVDQQKLMELPQKMQKLDDDKTKKAADDIAEHAKDNCDVDLKD